MTTAQFTARLADVTFAYGPRKALRGVTLSMGPGVTVLLGPNGAGKTTALDVIVGLRQPDSGTVTVGGVDLWSSEDDRKAYIARLGWMPQATGTAPRVTVRRFLEYACWLKAVDRSGTREAIDEACRATRTTQFLGRWLNQLSGGEHRRVMLAAALVSSPDVLVLDEPTVGLDPLERKAFLQALGGLAVSTSIMLSTHLLEDVAEVAQRVVVVGGGVTLYQGTLADFVGETAGSVSTQTIGVALQRLLDQG